MAHPRIKFQNMDLGPAVVAALNAEGWTRLEHIAGKSAAELAAIKGIGKTSAAKLVSEAAAMSA